METGIALKQYILEKYKSIRAFTKEIDIPYSTLDTMFKRGIQGASVSNVIKICNALGIDIDKLDEGIVEPKIIYKDSKLTDSEIIHINRYRKLDEHGKDMVDTVLHKEHERSLSERKVIRLPLEPQPERQCGTLNLSELKASAGTGVFLGEESMTPINVDFNRMTARADFAVPVDGNSMLPKYKDGDILLVHKQPAVNVGEIGIFIIDGLGYVKKQGDDRLISLNEDYDDIYLNENCHTTCCGKVIGILEPEWIIEE